MPNSPAPESIRLRGVHQNNLKGFDLDLPLGKFVVVTGLSGAGKSSLVFDTLHAEGQRRYVETFSAYTRQFLDLLDKPKVDSIENIRPSIAIEQSNTVKTSRSTVGTMTELTDFAKVWFSHVAECFDPATGEKVEDDNPLTIWTKTHAAHPAATLLLCFRITKPENLNWTEVLTSIKGQGYTRVLIGRGNAKRQAPKAKETALEVQKIDELLGLSPSALNSQLSASATLFVVQDRLAVVAENKSRFLEATESALHFGKGEIHLFKADDLAPAGHYSRGLHSPKTGRTFRAATPGLFSFNSPLGACPKCRGFGRIIDIDYRLTIPDHSLSIEDGAIKVWEGEIYGESKKDLIQFAKKVGLPTNVPFAKLTEEQKSFVIDGSPGYDGETNHWPKYWYGVKGFFRYLEKTTYKMHVRVFLSRYRAYNTCPECHGARLQPEALCWKWRGQTLPELYQLPISELLAAVGYAEGTEPLDELKGIQPGALDARLEVPGVGWCAVTAAGLAYPAGATLVLARRHGLTRQETALLGGMARVAAMTMTMLRLVDHERGAREEVERGRDRYDYLIVNDDLNRAFDDLLAVIRAERLRRSVETRAGRAVSPDLVRFLHPCYAAFQLGWWTMAADAHGGWPEEQARLRAQAERYRGALRPLLGL